MQSYHLFGRQKPLKAIENDNLKKVALCPSTLKAGYHRKDYEWIKLKTG